MGRYRATVWGASEEEQDHDDVSLSTVRSAPARIISGLIIDDYSNLTSNQYNENSNNGPVHWMVQPPMPLEYLDVPPSNNRKRSWVWVVGTIVLACLVASYGPPAPPPNSEGAIQTWKEFILAEVGRVLSATISMAYAITYSVSWSLVGVREDVRQYRRDWKESRRKVCPLMIPSSLGSSEEWLSKRIVEQDRAVSVVAAALDAWDIAQERKGRQRQPLLLLLTGRTGLGKMEMARQVAQFVFQHCSIDHDLGYLNEGVLVLRGDDFASEEVRSNSLPDCSDNVKDPAEELLRQIAHHVQRQKGAGAVVIIHHVENMAPLLFKRVCRLLRASDAQLTYSSDMIDSHDEMRIPKLQVTLHNVVFIFTTDVGSKTIAQSIKRFGSIESIPHVDLSLSLQHELDSYFGGDNGDLRSTFHGVAPFLPFGPSVMEKIARQKLQHLGVQHTGQYWKQLIVTESASKAFVSKEFVEYVEWKKPDSSLLLLFSTTGAKVLEDGSHIMNRLRSQLKRCPTDSDKHAVLDFDAAARQALVCLCDDESASCSLRFCREACRFYI